MACKVFGIETNDTNMARWEGSMLKNIGNIATSFHFKNDINLQNLTS